MIRIQGQNVGGDQVVAISRAEQSFAGTDLANINGLGVRLEDGKNYIIEGWVPFTGGAGGGVAFGFSVEADDVAIQLRIVGATEVTQALRKAVPADAISEGTVGDSVLEVRGTVFGGSGHDFVLQASQEDDTPESPMIVLAGGYLIATEIS